MLTITLFSCTYVFLYNAEEMSFVYDEIDEKDEPLFPSWECDQVCSVFFMTHVYHRFNIPII